MVAYRAQAIFPMKTGIPRDSVVNAWSFYIAGGDPITHMTAIKGLLKTLYDTWGTYRSADLDLAKAHLVWYNLDEPKPRAPVADDLLGLSAAQATNSLPHELSVCLSFQGVRTSGLIQARRRGRLYLGPWSTASNDGTKGRPDNGLLTFVQTAAQAFHSAMTAATDRDWAVYSPTTAAAGQPPLTVVDEGWVDNEWDIQRRRGNVSTARSTFT
jgi:hypothetical protein